MGDVLLREVENGKFDDVPDLVESIFSDAIISRGFPGAARVSVSDILTKVQGSDGPGSHRKMIDAFPGAWVQWLANNPGGLSREEQIADYMNKMGDKIRGLYSIPSNEDSHVFSARFRNKQPANPPVSCVRKPDICVLNSAISDLPDGKVNWEHLRAVVEHKESLNPVAFQAAYEELLNYARLIFASQPNRRFVLGMAILGDYATFFYFDRAGVISSDRFHIHENPEKFLRVIVGFLFASNTDLGYDPTIVLKDGKGFVTVKDKKYEIERIIYVESSLRGRGTVCYLAILDGKKYVIKDSWVDISRQSPEHQILKQLRGVAGVPTIAAYEVVKIGMEKDTTKRFRKFLKKTKFFNARELVWRRILAKAENREHRRIVMTPYGDSLETFSSLIELVSGIRDLVLIVRDLADNDILHRDLSLRNVILAKLDESSPLRRAFLIDYDLAINFIIQNSRTAKGPSNGYLCLSWLLSFLIPTQMVIPKSLMRPNNEERKNFNFAASEIGRWAGLDMDNANLEDIQMRKEKSVNNLPRFKSNVLGQFSPYFKDLHPCLLAMHEVLFTRQAQNSKRLGRGKAVLDAWAAMSKEERDLASDDFKEKVSEAKEDVPLSDQHQDEVFSDLVKILDDTLDDLSKKHGSPPPVTVVNNPSAFAIDAAAESPAVAARKKKRTVVRKVAKVEDAENPLGIGESGNADNGMRGAASEDPRLEPNLDEKPNVGVGRVLRSFVKKTNPPPPSVRNSTRRSARSGPPEQSSRRLRSATKPSGSKRASSLNSGMPL
ncbi:hypothetical protein DFH11DRAFT_1881400 [Phellopilus nigrolimitatus]|nr:hypothetical protein DFH11DRAFT_1881400 [Phellopilus nigrolimitatus]